MYKGLSLVQDLVQDLYHTAPNLLKALFIKGFVLVQDFYLAVPLTAFEVIFKIIVAITQPKLSGALRCA